MTVEELRKLYHSKVIPKAARSEIKGNFLKAFGYRNPQPFTMKMMQNSMEFPTPNEYEWLLSTVKRYHDYYSEITAQLELPHEKVA